MKLTHLPAAGFDIKPWKNGLGTTHDIIVAPQGADHDTFELRCALSPIVRDNLFSAFPGVERVITLIDGQGLKLHFSDQTVSLTKHKAHRFDTGLTPMGKLVDGPVKVVNVMARRGVWDIRSCTVTGACDISIAKNEMGFVFALDAAGVASGQAQMRLAQHDALCSSGAGTLALRPKDDGRVLFAHICPAQP